MNRERWQELRALFVDLTEREHVERNEALATLAERDPTLAAEVGKLLSSYDQANTRLLVEAITPPPPQLDRLDLTGQHLGPYRLTRPIGSGGMGVVYEALREEDGKRVAVKVLHAAEDSPEVERRLGAERRILAGLEHDHIARLIDGGITENGLTYFTMEFVEGRPITAFCCERQLGIAARLRLFCSLCAAVQYAHQRLIVHCDIKPGNVLVTASGVPKLLDFGIARWMRTQEAGTTALTSLQSDAMTPGYASPEQVQGLAVTTATDVYALGLLLFELLSDRPAQPLENFAPAEIVRVVCNAEPPRPSAVAPAPRRRQLAGDLDAIILKALRKEPAQRYPSAAALAEDIERHLTGQPVAARRGTWVYRASRFFSRNWLPVSAAAAVLALSLVAVLLTTIQSRRAERERVKADKVAEFLVDLFRVSDPVRPREAPLTAREVLDTAAGRIATELRDQPDVQVTLLDTVGRVYLNLGLYASATDFHRQALAMHRQRGPERSLEIANTLDQLGRSLFYQSKYGEAEALHREALAMRGVLVGAAHPTSAETLDHLAKAVGSQGRHAEAEEIHRQSLRLYRAAHGDEHPEVANGLSNLASDLYDQGKYSESEALNREALAIRRKTLGPDHRLVAWSLNNLANALQEQHKYGEAETIHREVLTTLRRIHGGDHPDIALALGNLAVDLYQQERLHEAEATHREALALNRKLLGNDSFFVAAALFNLAEVLSAKGDFEPVEPLLREALPLFQKLLGAEHPYCGKILASLAIAGAARNRPREAEAAGRAALALLQAQHPPEPAEIAEAEVALAVALAATGAFAEANTLWAHARTAAGGSAEARPPRVALEIIARRYALAGDATAATNTRRLQGPDK
jgi:eukaryotic-like serine/threonine-protein kinase